MDIQLTHRALDDGCKRTYRVFSLLNHCISNIAAYRSGWIDSGDKKVLRIHRDFWIRLNGNFLDIATLDWCKVFADFDGKHHWTRIIKNKHEFRTALLQNLGLTREQFGGHVQKIRDYRDKYVAHLDDPIAAEYPHTKLLLDSSSFLYDKLKESQESSKYLIGVYDSASDLYFRRSGDALAEVHVAIDDEVFLKARSKYN